MNDTVIVGAARTPIGNLSGALSSFRASDLGSMAIHEALLRAQVEAEEVSDVIMGQVLTAGQGQNPARQAAIAAQVPEDKTAMTINQVCGSGLRAVALGHQAIRLGESDIVVAGGQESMSQATHSVYLRSGVKMGDTGMVDTMISDGLWCAFGQCHMGITAENIAKQWKLSRETQDEFAASSQQKAEAAQKAGRFAEEIVPINVRKRKEVTVVDTDEFPRPGTTVESLAKLRPAFGGPEGTVTAGNASGINDGGSAVVLMSAAEADRRGLEPLARIASWATAGVDPSVMGTGPIPASRLALERTGWSVDDLDLIEANEAFAAQALVVNRELGWDPDKVNVNGGAIALGHPIGASGNRVLVTLLHELRRRDAKRGLATLCIGGGMGIAVCVERP